MPFRPYAGRAAGRADKSSGLLIRPPCRISYRSPPRRSSARRTPVGRANRMAARTFSPGAGTRGAVATRTTVRCITSASTGSVGRRPLRAAVPTAWTSATPGSSRRISSTVRTAFSCVASRNRVVPSGPGPGLPRQRMARNRRRVGQVVERRLQRVRLVVDGGRRLCLPLVLLQQRSQSAGP